MNQLEVFCLVAEKESFSEAARLMYLSQPSVSFQIQALENELGVKLFNRTKQGISMTAHGKTYYRYAKEMVKLNKQAKSLISSYQKGKLHVNLGVESGVGNYVVPLFLEQLRRFNDNLVVTCYISNSFDINERLQKEILDIAISSTENYERKNLWVGALLDEKIVLVLPADYWSKNNESFEVDELLDIPLVMREKGSGIRETIEQRLIKSGLSLKNLDIAVEIADNQAIKELVISGFGGALLPEGSIEREAQLGLLRAYPCNEAIFNFSVNLITTKRKREQEPLKNLLDQLVNSGLVKNGSKMIIREPYQAG
ncbi:MAG: LysR family transcriptional regulator [Bacillota bacterium]